MVRADEDPGVRWRRLQELWRGARDRPPEQRQRWLEEACADPSLREEVAALLSADATVAERYERLVGEEAAAWQEEEAADEAHESMEGRDLGYLRFGRPLGMGGMGRVYEARDRRLGRRVAVKVLHPELELEGSLESRLLREARLLAGLEHPSICQIHDIVEERGTVGIVLEHIPGESLATILARQRERGESVGEARALDWAIAIAGALEAAHGAGVVHRDLKPANVMIRPDGTPAVLDFGIARRTGGGAAVASGEPEDRSSVAAGAGLTRTGAVLGTPRYLSPEQARGEPAGPAADIFAFGLVLYELICGRRVFEDSASAETLVGGIAAWRLPSFEEVPARFEPLLRTLLAPAPGARPSASEVRRQLELLRDEPRRRRGRRIRNAAVAILAVFAAVMAWQAVRLGQEAERARREKLTADRISTFLVELFETANPYGEDGEGGDGRARGERLSARDLVEEGIERLSTDLADEPVVRGRLLARLSEVALSLGMYQEAERIAADAAGTLTAAIGPDNLDVASSRHNQAVAAYFRGDPETALRQLEESLGVLRRIADHEPEVAEALGNISSIAETLGDAERAESAAREALAIRRAHGDEVGAARAAVRVAAIDLARGRRAEERRHLLAAVEALAPAVETLRDHLGADHPDTAWAELNLAAVSLDLGECDTALDLYRRSLARNEAALGAEHPTVWADRADLGNALARCERPAQAEELLRSALAGLESVHGADHYELLRSIEPLARLALEADDPGRAEALWQRAQEIADATYPEGHWRRFAPRIGRAEAALASGRAQEALDRLLPLLPQLEATGPARLARRAEVALAEARELAAGRGR